MSATVFGSSQYSIVDDATATGMKLSNLDYNATSDQAEAADHTGSVFAYAVYNDRTEISADGVVVVKTDGIGLVIANVLTLANDTANAQSLTDDYLFTASDVNAASILTTINLTRTNREFETGSLNAMYYPLVDTATPTVIAS